MKTNYTIKNFRVFDNKGITVEISPLTFLVGCNSSGKSSIVKSLSLLKTIFRKPFGKDHPVIGSEIDFSTKPNDSLGTFNNVVRTSSRKKEFSLSYEVYSAYINENVVVSLTICNGSLGNGVINSVEIAKKDGAVLVAYSGYNHLSGNLSYVKEAFKEYLVATRYRSMVNELLPDHPNARLSSIAMNQIEDLEQAALRYCPAGRLNDIYHNKTIVTPHIDGYVQSAIDKFAETGILTYYSIFDDMNEMTTPEAVSAFFKSKVKDDNLRETMLMVIDYVVDSYKQSGADTFPSFYSSLEAQAVYDARNFSSKVIGVDSFIFSMLRMSDMIYSIAEDKAGSKKLQLSYKLVYDMLSHLVGDEPYSYLKREENHESSWRRVHPLLFRTFNDFLDGFCHDVFSKDVTDGLEYISSSRIQVRRLYPMEDRNEFSEAVRRYFDARTKFLDLYPIQNKFDDTIVNGPDFAPGGFMNKWLKVFKIGDHISLEMDNNGLGLLLKIYRSSSDKKGSLLADMGYGITQLFSILLQIEEMIMSKLYEKFKGAVPTKRQRAQGILSVGCWMTEEELNTYNPSTLAIEEPEIHLHPKYQSLLAEMIYEAYKEYNIQFIIETHSEYLLRKIQTLVGASKLSPEEVSMVYIEDDEEVKKGTQKVRRILVKKDGRLAAPFGPGFYDEADNLSLELFANMAR